MVFSSITFLGLFLPAVLLLYYISPGRHLKNMILLAASLVFYAWGEPIWVFAMLALSLLDYIACLFLISRKGMKRKWLLVITIILNLAMLFLFKYYNFLAGTAAELAGRIGITIAPEAWPYAMPIGISFFTFQAITYVVDVYREEVRPQKNPLKVILYISLFPQLIAGPIVRYHDVEQEISQRNENLKDFSAGALRFAIGLGKKVIFANYAGKVATSLLTDNIGTITADAAWIGAIMYALQIYYDFSGYSDMAIGLGRMFGFHFLENFNYPYISRSITEFWRRWHMSLGTFFRDYVYIPLGGNRRHAYLNILLVWALTGLWHGASWNFVLWGLFYAVLLIIEKLLRKNDIEIGKLPIISNLLVLIITLFGWIIFYYDDIGQMGTCLSAMLGLRGIGIELTLLQRSSINSIFYLLPIMALGATPLPAKLSRRWTEGKWYQPAFAAVCMVGLITLSFTLIVSQTYNPFLYFRF